MDNFDDPIGDLLSEGSNDSFFEDPKLLAKKTTPKKNAKSVEDLFGFGAETKTITSKDKTDKNNDWLGLDDKPKDPPKKIERKLSFDDTSNLLGLSNEPKTTAAKKSSIMSDLLGETKKEEKMSTFDDILQSSSIKKKDTIIKEDKSKGLFDDILQGSKKKDAVTLESKPRSPLLSREPRRGRRNSPGIIDPLGIFGSQTKEPDILDKSKLEKKTIETSKAKSLSFLDPAPIEKRTTESKIQPQAHKTTKSTDLPDWLGLKETKIIKPPKAETEIVKSVDTIPQETISQLELRPSDSTINSQNIETLLPQRKNQQNESSSSQNLESLLSQQKLSSSHFELQSASFALQQQESQLMVAVQLKKYEETMAEMAKNQQDMLFKQDIQFNSLLERQLAKQQTMESNMRHQQERINNHIQLLMAQPAGVVSARLSGSEEESYKLDYLKTTFEDNRKFYDDIITSLKQKHKEEIFLLEESYRKQLSFLENSVDSTESRLKTEIDNINKHYNNKIEEIEIDKGQIIAKYEDRIKTLYEQHTAEIETIKDNYKTTVADVRNEYKSMMDDISQNKYKQDEIISDAKMMTNKIDESLEVLGLNTRTISEIQTKIQNEHSLLLHVKGESLDAKEIEIKMIKKNLEEQRLSTDNERAQLLALIKTLETRLVEQTQSAREERWAFQQAAATLAARSSALDRESEFVRRNLEREREQVKTLKETLLAEHEDTILKLNEGKLALVAEKSRLEVSHKLYQNFDMNKGKTEIEAAIKIAKEATALTDKERQKLCDQQCETELLKRSLSDRESKLHVKEQELKNLFNSAEQKSKDGERAFLEAKITEQKYTEKLQEIQKQLNSLAMREKKLTEDKIALSKERISLHSQFKSNKKCGLCEAGNTFKTNFEPELRNQVEHDYPWGPETEILRLKHDMEKDNEVSREHSILDNDSDT